MNAEPQPETVELDAIVRRALGAAAGTLQTTLASVPGWALAEGATGVRGSDLQRAVCDGLAAQLGSVACIEGPTPATVKEHWPGWLGRADVLVRLHGRPDTYFETQLCGMDKLHESLWDALKLALYTALSEGSIAYLVYAAPDTAWEREGHHPRALFEGGTFALEELLEDSYPQLWTWCLQGTRMTRPLNLPGDLHSEPIARALARGPAVDWELRCVRIHGESAAGWIAFDAEGWPLEEPARHDAATAEGAADALQPAPEELQPIPADPGEAD